LTFDFTERVGDAGHRTPRTKFEVRWSHLWKMWVYFPSQH